MKKLLQLILIFFLASISAVAQVTTDPAVPEADQPVIIYFDKSATDLSGYNGTIYAHIGVTVNNTTWQYVVGSWGNNTTQPALAHVSGTIYSLTISPDIYTYFGVPTSDALTQISVVFRNAVGNAQSEDIFINVGAFQVTLDSPVLNSTTILNPGDNLLVSASNTGDAANYNLLANGVSIYTSTGTTFNYTDTNITTNKNYELLISSGSTTFSRRFSVLLNPGVFTEAMPAGLVDGINYDSADATKATLVLQAPGKDFIYVAGNFNSWQPGTAHAMRKDPVSNKFWLELTGLTPNQDYLYQYWVGDATPFAGSPAIVKTADPFSTLVINPYDDPYISSNTYPNIPAYPAGQERDITVLRTGQTPYNWQVTNFTKPKKEDLVVYEVLIRDFDADRNFQDIIDRIDYFNDLNINAIELMPIMEFEGNESWGYNTSFHMALDKFYGTSDKFKELVDVCHQNGIAVILDIALNHAFGRNPLVRMWMKDADGDGWGDPSAENPYFNEFAKHSYNVGADFNHASPLTQNYVRRVTQHWITEYKIDGFRWDLTKGFTQACSGGDDACTNAFQADRVAILKDYVDYTWSLDPSHYAIFEHLGSDSEEQQWANYRINESPSKGVMMWGEITYPYTQLIEGYATGGDISRIGHESHGFTAKRLIGYPESHDKERLIYSAMTYGNAAGTAPPFNNLNNSLARMSTVAATSLLVPGPKMIWHFADLGYDDSIYTCSNGSVNTESDTTPGDCKLDTKPQEQWTNNWMSDPLRMQIRQDYAKMIDMKINEPVFEGDYAISPNGNNVRQRIYVYNDALPSSQLKNVVILANYAVAAQNITPDFPYAGTWYNLMDNTTIAVTNTAAQISIPAGQFRIYGNQLPTLANQNFDSVSTMSLYPNPSNDYFSVNADVMAIEIYTMTGQRVKEFGEANEGTEFAIDDIAPGIYVVKITDDANHEKTTKLIKK